jgi:death-on-curing protein
MKEPRWLSRVVIDAVHVDQLREHGGLSGVRDENALESALARPRNKWEYNDDSDIAELAAAYGYALSSSHPYRDGNKRIAFLAMVIFLGLNGYELSVSETEVVATVLALADNRLSERKLSTWLRNHMERSPNEQRGGFN